jgi:hypothetical protein
VDFEALWARLQADHVWERLDAAVAGQNQP